MTDARTSPRSNALYSAIVATVAATTDRRLSVREIALRVEADVDTTAQCIALHRYLRAHAYDADAGMLQTPMPADFVIPAFDELIDEAALGLNLEPPIAA